MPLTVQLDHALIRRKQVEAQTGLPRSTLYKLIANGDFPAPVRLTVKAVAWVRADVDSWIAGRIAASKPQ
mgnify:CR=1 FL=1|jgi:prophage regulatory protein